MIDRDGVEHLSPKEHLDRADAALAAAQKLRKEMDDREEDRGKELGKSSPWYLAREHDFLTLMQIANLHANMATAKGIALLGERTAPVHFYMPDGMTPVLPDATLEEAVRDATDRRGMKT